MARQSPSRSLRGLCLKWAAWDQRRMGGYGIALITLDQNDTKAIYNTSTEKNVKHAFLLTDNGENPAGFPGGWGKPSHPSSYKACPVICSSCRCRATNLLVGIYLDKFRLSSVASLHK
ncbi:unnamed protein product [Ilex paraguariensis]|uniref:Uncharacterized protein n=1 Tax=Ilex paraguariensis TaxID=185542 RepID=A0ABC8RSP1_9AQUA